METVVGLNIEASMDIKLLQCANELDAMSVIEGGSLTSARLVHIAKAPYSMDVMEDGKKMDCKLVHSIKTIF